MPLAEQETKALDTVHESAQMPPVGHAEGIVGWRPFPPSAMRRIIHAVQAEQVEAHDVVGERRVHEVRRGRAPAAAVEAFEPHARTFIQVRDGGGDLRLDQVFAEAGLIGAGPLVPPLGTEVVAELQDVTPTAAMVAAHRHAALLVPVEHRFEESLLAQRDHHVAVVEPDFRRARADVLEQGRQLRRDVVALALFEFPGERSVQMRPLTPKPSSSEKK